MRSGEAFDQALAWCRAHDARVQWSVDETLCQVTVRLPGKGQASIAKEGPDLVTVVARLRAAYRSFLDGTPTKSMRRPQL